MDSFFFILIVIILVALSFASKRDRIQKLNGIEKRSTQKHRKAMQDLDDLEKEFF